MTVLFILSLTRHCLVELKQCKVPFFLFKDHIIIELTKTGLKKVSEDGEEPVMEEDPFLVVNPNYVLED